MQPTDIVKSSSHCHVLYMNPKISLIVCRLCAFKATRKFMIGLGRSEKLYGKCHDFKLPLMHCTLNQQPPKPQPAFGQAFSAFAKKIKRQKKTERKPLPNRLKLAPNGTQSYVDNFSFKPTKIQTSYTTSPLGDVVGAGNWLAACGLGARSC